MLTIKHLMTHWGWDKMAAILQIVFSNSLSCMKIVVFFIHIINFIDFHNSSEWRNKMFSLNLPKRQPEND